VIFDRSIPIKKEKSSSWVEDGDEPPAASRLDRCGCWFADLLEVSISKTTLS
jgi:hypothetical protein